jgi:hypothetical protein
MATSLVIVEGATEVAITKILLAHLGFARQEPSGDDPLFPRPRAQRQPNGSAEDPQAESPAGPSEFVARGDRGVWIRSAGGRPALLGTAGLDLATARRDLHALAIVVDAEDEGVNPTIAKLRRNFQGNFDALRSLAPGQVIPGPTRLGAWVSPDNRSKGSFDDLLLAALAEHRPPLHDAARAFVAGTEAFERLTEIRRAKAALGAALQADRPGVSIASALRAADRSWAAPAPGSALGVYSAFLQALLSP